MDVSIIIVSYNTKDLLKQTIDSVIKQTLEIEYEIIVVDNASTDGSVEMIENYYKSVILIKNKKNLGFGAANNCGIKIAKGKYIFYLNSDTILLNNAVKIFFDFFEGREKENIGCLGACLIDESGNPIHSWKSYPTPLGTLKALIHMWLLPDVGGISQNSKIPDKEYEIIDGYITGADMFLKNNKSAYFDERFFMYAEECDLQYNNFYKKNMQNYLLYEPQIIHLVGGSDKSQTSGKYDFSRNSTAMNWKSLLLYLKKNYPENKMTYRIIMWILCFIWSRPKYRENCKEHILDIKQR